MAEGDELGDLGLDAFQGSGGHGLLAGLGLVLGVVGGDGVAEVLDVAVGFDAGEDVHGRGVVFAGGEAGEDGFGAGGDFVEAFVAEVEFAANEIGFQDGFLVAFELALGGGLDGAEDAEEGIARGLFFGGEFLFADALAEHGSQRLIDLAGQGVDLHGQVGGHFCGGKRGGVGGVQGGRGDLLGVGDFLDELLVQDAVRAFGLGGRGRGRGWGGWNGVSHGGEGLRVRG